VTVIFVLVCKRPRPQTHRHRLFNWPTFTYLLTY